MNLGIVLALVGIVLTLYIFFKQKQRGRFKITTVFKKEEFKGDKDTVYRNEDASLDIELKSNIKLTYKYPITIDSFILGKPKYLPFSIPNFFLRIWPFIENLPLNILESKLPIKLNPNEKVEGIRIRGLTLNNVLNQHGFFGETTLMFGFFDDNKNVYYGPTFKVQVSELQKDSGEGIWMKWM